MSQVVAFTPIEDVPRGAPGKEEVAGFQRDVHRLIDAVSSVVVTSEHTVRLALTGLFAGGHVLLEDVPGVGKTLLGKTIASSIDCDFKRIQFTPDLLPSDVTGTTIFDMQASRFDFIPGPIFSNVVLADEVNRASPRTQSAMLEAMAEFQVSVDGEVRHLPSPFIVIATQNLSESHGTFPLPDSQKDRFLISMRMGMPTPEQETEILARSRDGATIVRPVLTGARVIHMQDIVQRVEVSAPIRQYIVNLAVSTRRHPAIRHGVSPRGSAALQRAAQCWAALSGRPFVAPEDVQAVTPHVVSHRLMMDPRADIGAEAVVSEVLRSVAVPA